MRSLAVALVLTALALGCGRSGTRWTGSAEGRTSMQPNPTPPPPRAPSEDVQRDVRGKLYGDPLLTGGGSIVVTVDGSRVILEGWVGSENERTLAEADAWSVPGVGEVDDRLVVRPWGVASPRARR